MIRLQNIGLPEEGATQDQGLRVSHHACMWVGVGQLNLLSVLALAGRAVVSCHTADATAPANTYNAANSGSIFSSCCRTISSFCQLIDAASCCLSSSRRCGVSVELLAASVMLDTSAQPSGWLVCCSVCSTAPPCRKKQQQGRVVLPETANMSCRILHIRARYAQ